MHIIAYGLLMCFYSCALFLPFAFYIAFIPITIWQTIVYGGPQHYLSYSYITGKSVAKPAYTPSYEDLTVQRGNKAYLVGVSLSGPEAGKKIPGTYVRDYVYPDVDYFAKFYGPKGNNFTMYRIPISWERMQRTLRGDLSSFDVAALTTVVNQISQLGAYAIIDLHNYGRYMNTKLSLTNSPSGDDLADFWVKLSTQFMDYNNVVFEIMNEPHGFASSATWYQIQQKSVEAIRAQEDMMLGADTEPKGRHLIQVMGNYYGGSYSWNQVGFDDDGNNLPDSNAQAFTKLTTYLANTPKYGPISIDMHLYFDNENSGKDFNCSNIMSTSIGVTRITDATTWLNAQQTAISQKFLYSNPIYGLTGFIGEFATGSGSICLTTLTNFLKAIENQRSTWIGWGWWTDGPFYTGQDYDNNLRPSVDGTPSPQNTVIKTFVK